MRSTRDRNCMLAIPSRQVGFGAVVSCRCGWPIPASPDALAGSARRARASGDAVDRSGRAAPASQRADSGKSGRRPARQDASHPRRLEHEPEDLTEHPGNPLQPWLEVHLPPPNPGFALARGPRGALWEAPRTDAALLVAVLSVCSTVNPRTTVNQRG